MLWMTILTILLNTIYATNLNIFSICFYFCQITPLIFRLQIISVRGGILVSSTTFCSAVVVVTSCENIIMYWLEMAIFSGKIEITSQPTTQLRGKTRIFLQRGIEMKLYCPVCERWHLCYQEQPAQIAHTIHYIQSTQTVKFSSLDTCNFHTCAFDRPGAWWISYYSVMNINAIISHFYSLNYANISAMGQIKRRHSAWIEHVSLLALTTLNWISTEKRFVISCMCEFDVKLIRAKLCISAA